MTSPFNILVLALVVLAAVLAYYSISVSSLMWTLNALAVAGTVGIEIIKLASDDVDYSWAENRKFALINLAMAIIAVNLTVLYVIRAVA